MLERTWLVPWSQLPPGSPCAAGMWPARCAGLLKEGHVGFVTHAEKELSASKLPSLGLDFEILAAGNGFFLSIRAARPFLQAALMALSVLEHCHSKVTGTDCRCHCANPSGMGFLRAAEGCITFCLFGFPQLHPNATW